jgi:hypothetical protein
MIVVITDAPSTNNARMLCVAPSKQASKAVTRLRSHDQEAEEREKRQGRFPRQGTPEGFPAQETNRIRCLPDSPLFRQDNLLEGRPTG